MLWHVKHLPLLHIDILVPSPILGLANAPIVETKFLELAMSFLDFSPRIPLCTFSILLRTHTISETKGLCSPYWLEIDLDLELEPTCMGEIVALVALNIILQETPGI